MTTMGPCASCPLAACPEVPIAGAPDPDILLVGGFPLQTDAANKTPFTSAKGAILRRVVSDLLRKTPRAAAPKIAYGYAVRCAPPYLEDKKRFLISAEIVSNCSSQLMHYIDVTRPKAIVALGADALRALGFKENAKAMRGGIYTIMVGLNQRIPVVATYHIVEVTKQPGLLTTLIADLKKAFSLVSDATCEAPMRLHTPTSAQDILEALEQARENIASRFVEAGKPVALAVDTETTSLIPSNQEDRVIAVSLSWESMQGLAFPFEHRQCPHTPEAFERIKHALATLLSNEQVSLVMCNGKFDTQWLRYRYGMEIAANTYDVQLAEHVLDEDKKGEYSLKDITKDRFPAMGKYEEELKQAVNEGGAAIAAQLKEAREAHKEDANAQFLQWWLDKSTEERIRLLGAWVSLGYMQLSDTLGLEVVKHRKRHGELVIPKKYQTAVAKMLSSVPVEALSGLELPSRPNTENGYTMTYEQVPLTTLLHYAAIDALATRMLVGEQLNLFRMDSQRMEKIGKELGRPIPTPSLWSSFEKISMPLSHCLAHMEYHGVRLNREEAFRYATVLREKIEEAKDVLYTEVGYRFNPSSSSPDLARILFTELGLPVLKKTDTGAASTDADTLKELANKHTLPFLDKLLVYRKLDKCLHTYVENWLDMSARDGRIHCSFNQIGTATYRLSSSAPNLQNVPFSIKEAGLNLKALFLPDEGYELYDLDISNAEMRILTAYSRDEALIDAFNTGKDLHCLTASGISAYSYEDLMACKDDKNTDQYRKRQLAKKVNFGTIYCMSSERLQQQLWAELRIEESLENCQSYLDGFFETYPGVKKYIDSTKLFVERYHITYTYTGRRRRFPMVAYNRGQASRMARQAVNARIQTTSSDLVMLNLIDLHRALLPMNGRVLLTVHDSIPFQLPVDTTGVRALLDTLILDNTAQKAPWLPVKWKYDVGRGKNYGDTHGEVL